MREYILAIAGVILLSAVVTVIAPGGKMGKFVKGMMKLFILVVMIAPMISWVKGGSLDFSVSTNIGVDEGYLKACSARLEKADEEAIAAYIQSEFSCSAAVEVTRSDDAFFRYKKIMVNISWEGIFGADEHIHIMSRIKEALEAKYGCEVEVS